MAESAVIPDSGPALNGGAFLSAAVVPDAAFRDSTPLAAAPHLPRLLSWSHTTLALWLMIALSPEGGAEVMSENQIAILAAPARERADDRLSSVALFLAILVLAVGLTYVTGPIEQPALDPEISLVGP